jgi:hypothetical protein
VLDGGEDLGAAAPRSLGGCPDQPGGLLEGALAPQAIVPASEISAGLDWYRSLAAICLQAVEVSSFFARRSSGRQDGTGPTKATSSAGASGPLQPGITPHVVGDPRRRGRRSPGRDQEDRSVFSILSDGAKRYPRIGISSGTDADPDAAPGLIIRRG